MSFVKIPASAMALAAVAATAATARDHVQVAGSSTVLPYASIVAEAFGENFDFPTPVIESGGSSAGLKRFCEGLGEHTIDVANASRRIKDSELAKCSENGVTDIIEVRIGYDGIVFASDIHGTSFAFTPVDWFLALSDEILVDGNMTANTARTWADVNDNLPAQPIQAFIPGTKHGTREVFEDKVILAGCEATGAFDVLLDQATGDTAKAKKKAAEKKEATTKKKKPEKVATLKVKKNNEEAKRKASKKSAIKRAKRAANRNRNSKKNKLAAIA